MTLTKLTRRQLIASAAASAIPFPARAVEMPEGWVPSDDYLPRVVEFRDELLVGALIVDPDLLELYHVTAPQSGMLYSVGVGRGDLYEAGTFTVGAKKRWPSWTPTQDMIDRNPDQYARYAKGMPGGPGNPLGSRALYLFDEVGNDSFLRIHGTPEPWTVPSAVSNGCVRLVNEHVELLYDSVELGAPVFLLPRLGS